MERAKGSDLKPFVARADHHREAAESEPDKVMTDERKAAAKRTEAHAEEHTWKQTERERERDGRVRKREIDG